MEQQKRFASNWALVAGIIGLLAITLTLALFVRSKDQSKPQTSASVTSPTTPTALGAPASTPPVNSVASPAPAPKKAAKKRPSTVTYSEPNYGISFRYPRKYSLKTGETSASNPGPSPAGMNTAGINEDMNFVQPGGVNVATVVLPQNAYPETDFQSAFFSVSINQSMTADECGKFAFPSHLTQEEVQPAKLKIGGMELFEVEQMDGEPPNQADAKYYHVFQNGACYEFALGVGTMADPTVDPVTPVDRAQVFERLEKILSSVKIKTKSIAVPEVAAGSAAQPVEEKKQ